MKINNLVLGMILILLYSSIFNYETIENYLINIILVFNIYILTKYRWSYVYKNLYYLALFFNIINICIYVYSPKIYSTPKIIFGHELSKIQLQEIGVSAISIIAIYSLFSIVLIKSRLLKVVIMTLSLFTILIGGKFTTILAILVSFMIYVVNIKLSFFRSKLKYILKLLLIISFSSSFILYLFIKIFEKLFSIKSILSGRSILWVDYINYILENKVSLLLGNGFFNDSKMISYLSHPHNQYLTILYTLGIFGFIIFYLLLSKSIDRILKVVKIHPDLLIIFIILIIQMCGDDYYVLTIEPIEMIFIFLIYNIKYAKK
ncbi:O-antigen ligase family protein [Fusobacterium nucleatum]|uniref:O-antigen ligase family protein n=1 Tax=Fusobacterium nucleatum TaxID=851 RepID=UPI0030CBD54C